MSYERELKNFLPDDVKRNPAIAARFGEPDPKKVERFAQNMLERRESGQPYQIMPGVVRILDSGDVELIAGSHRLAAIAKLNDAMPKDTPDAELYYFEAIAIPADDEQALLAALDENEFRVASSALDKAESFARLEALGKTQKDIAERYGYKPSTVSDYLKLRELPKKLKDKIERGTLTEEAAVVFARYNKDTKLQEEYADLAEVYAKARTAVEARAEARAKGETEPESETEQVKGAAPVSEAVKGKGKKGAKVTAADAKKAVANKGGQKRKKKSAKADTGHTKKDLFTFFEATFGDDVQEEVPEPYTALATAIEKYLTDSEFTELRLKNAWVKAVREKFAASSAA